MNRNASISTVGRRSYRLLFTLVVLILFTSIAVGIYMGREAALGCFIWATASSLPISLLTTVIGSLAEELRHVEATGESGSSESAGKTKKSA